MKTELIANFAAAAGALTADALTDLLQPDRDALAAALASEKVHLRLVVLLSPLVIVGAAYSTVDDALPPQPLFRIESGHPSEFFQ